MVDRNKKKPYASPRVAVIGAFSQLTSGGSGTVVEAGMRMAMMRRA
ncbi:MAG: hypothetical protein KTR19_04050 [Hyphomicrobiales bacterium]|nr:hypothetical protein [uncultured Erythrobacter sp.]MBX2805127.1 hypothetical protein [Hyphomicrobiales bacterium]